MSTPRVYLIDASLYIFRAWHSMPDDFVDPSGRPTNAVYGFGRFLCDLLEQTGTRHLALAFDESLSSSFRNEISPDYKANRDPAPDVLLRQFDWCQQLGQALGVMVWSSPRYEADDLIATLASRCQQAGRPVCVVSGDKDLAQVLQKNDWWWDYPRRDPLDPQGVRDHFGVYPEQIADYLALTGDAVDNIAGVPGVGPKTAARLLNHFGNLDALFERLEEVEWLSFRGARTLAPKLRQGEDAARLARRLTGLHDQASPLPAHATLERGPGDAAALDRLLDNLGFGQGLRERMHRLLP